MGRYEPMLRSGGSPQKSRWMASTKRRLAGRVDVGVGEQRLLLVEDVVGRRPAGEQDGGDHHEQRERRAEGRILPEEARAGPLAEARDQARPDPRLRLGDGPSARRGTGQSPALPGGRRRGELSGLTARREGLLAAVLLGHDGGRLSSAELCGLGDGPDVAPERHTAVDAEDRARHVVVLIAGEEDDDRGPPPPGCPAA